MNMSNLEIVKVNEYLAKHKGELSKEVGNIIKRIRKEKEISISQMAERTCMNVSYLRQLEKGDYGVTLIKLITICNALEVSPNLLLNDFIVGDKANEDLIYEELQGDKNLSKNIIEVLKR